MDARRYKDIVGLRTRDGRVLGFHSQNLEVAELSEELWVAFASDPHLSELEEWNQEHSEEAQDLPSASGFKTFSLNIAQVCNLKCDYCAAGGDGSYGSKVAKIKLERAFKQIQYFLKNVQPGETFNLHFIGGEPLLFPNAIEQIMNYSRLYIAGRDIHLKFSITTNGTLINESVAQLLARMNALVTVSLDGDFEFNDKVRPTKNGESSTQLTLNGLKELSKVKNQLSGVYINSVFGDHNIQVLKTYKFLKSLPLKLDGFNFNYAANLYDAEFSPLYTQQMIQLAELAYEEGGLKELCRISQFREPLKRIASQTRKRDYCGAGKTLIKTDTLGDLHVCNWFMNDPNERVGSEDKINVVALDKYKKPLMELNNCESCWARFVCAGGCMYVNKLKTGDKHGKDPYFCERSRQLLATAIEYYAKDLT